MLQENEKEHSSVVDFLTDACKVVKAVKRPDGRTEQTLVLDTKRVYYKTHSVDSNYFGRSVLELEQYDNLADQAKYHMSAPRAMVISEQIKGNVEPYRYSVDGKSSESQRDKNNARMTLIDKLNKNKTEHVYSMKDETKKSLFEGWLGKKTANDAAKDS